MDSQLMGLIELLLVFGMALAFGIWQLVSLRRDRARALREEAGRTPSDGPGQA